MSRIISSSSSSSLVVGQSGGGDELHEAIEGLRLEQLMDTLHQRYARLGKRQSAGGAAGAAAASIAFSSPATAATAIETAPTDFRSRAATGTDPNFPDSTRATTKTAGLCHVRQTSIITDESNAATAATARATELDSKVIQQLGGRGSVPHASATAHTNTGGDPNASGILASGASGHQSTPGTMVLRQRASAYWEERELYIAAEDLCCFLNGGVNYRLMCYQYQHVLDLLLRMVGEDVGLCRSLLASIDGNSGGGHSSRGGPMPAASGAMNDMATVDHLVRELRTLLQESGCLLKQSGIELPAGFGSGLLSENTMSTADTAKTPTASTTTNTPAHAGRSRRGQAGEVNDGTGATVVDVGHTASPPSRESGTVGGRSTLGTTLPIVAIVADPADRTAHGAAPHPHAYPVCGGGGVGNSSSANASGSGVNGGIGVRYTPLSNMELASVLRPPSQHHTVGTSHTSTSPGQQQQSILSTMGLPASATMMGGGGGEYASGNPTARPPSGGILRTSLHGPVSGGGGCGNANADSGSHRSSIRTRNPTAATANRCRDSDGTTANPTSIPEPVTLDKNTGALQPAPEHVAKVRSNAVNDSPHGITGASQAAAGASTVAACDAEGSALTLRVNSTRTSPNPTARGGRADDRKLRLLSVYGEEYRFAGMELMLDAMDLVFRSEYDQPSSDVIATATSATTPETTANKPTSTAMAGASSTGTNMTTSAVVPSALAEAKAAFKTFRRDLTERVLPSLESYATFRAATADVTPVRSAYLSHCLATRTKPKTEVLEMLATTDERDIDALRLDGAKLGDAGALALLRVVPRLHRLRVLDLRHNDLRDEMLCGLVAATRHHPALTTIMLANNRFTDAALGPLVALARSVPRLQEITLQACEVSQEMRQALAAELANPGSTGLKVIADDGNEDANRTNVWYGSVESTLTPVLHVAAAATADARRADSAPTLVNASGDSPNALAPAAAAGVKASYGATPPPRVVGSKIPSRPPQPARPVRYLPMPLKQSSLVPSHTVADRMPPPLPHGDTGDARDALYVRLPALPGAERRGSADLRARHQLHRTSRSNSTTSSGRHQDDSAGGSRRPSGEPK